MTVSQDTTYEDAISAEEVLAKVIDDLGEATARKMAEWFKVEFDEAAIAALRSPNGSQHQSERMIEDWRQPKKRDRLA
jgi:NAD-dependent DNA ligase